MTKNGTNSGKLKDDKRNTIHAINIVHKFDKEASESNFLETTSQFRNFKLLDKIMVFI